MTNIYPATIVHSRYGGSYEHDESKEQVDWLAWPLRADELPVGWDASDVECMEFWRNYKGLVGRGMTPNEALANLERQMENKP